MVKVRFKVSKEALQRPDQDMGDFVTPKPGIYVLTVVEVNPGFTKDSDGEPDKTRPYLEFIYKITGVGAEEADVTENYGNVWDYVSFSEESDWKRAQILKAYGLSDGEDDFDEKLETDKFLNRKVIARLKLAKGQTSDDPKRAKVARLIAYGSDVSGAFNSSGTDYGETEYEETFGATEEDRSLYTVDELDAMDLKELGKVLKEEFEQDPVALLVKFQSGKNKGKTDLEETKVAVINAILEAQGEVEEEGTSGDDDDPFGDFGGSSDGSEEPF